MSETSFGVRAPGGPVAWRLGLGMAVLAGVLVAVLTVLGLVAFSPLAHSDLTASRPHPGATSAPGSGPLQKAQPTPAGGAVAAGFVQLQAAAGWYVTRKDHSEVSIQNVGDGFIDLTVQPNGGAQPGDFLQSVQQNIEKNVGKPVAGCSTAGSATIGGVPGQQAGFSYLEQDQNGFNLKICDVYWFGNVGNVTYGWETFAQQNQLGLLKDDVAAMQRSATWAQ